MEKNNKLIAEFMGYTHPFNDITDATLYLVSHGTFNSSELKYDTSWDWLMPVVNKCYQDYGRNAHFLQHDEHLQESIKNREIDEVYQVLVEFIKGL